MTLTWTAWNNGKHSASGAGYGLKVPIADRDRYFKKSWKTVVVDISTPSGHRQIEVNVGKKSFWSDSCHELISKAFGAWLLKTGKAPWPAGQPPKLSVAVVGDRHFRVLEDQAGDRSANKGQRETMTITKSSRHSKITGDFAERLVLYWLSKYGFECALVDHVGLDLIARSPHTTELMGISVKSRSRIEGTENEHINIAQADLRKLNKACTAFSCVPYLAIVVDAGDTISGFILSKTHLLELYRDGKKVIAWAMSQDRIRRYEADPEIKWFRFQTSTPNWW